MRVAPLAPRSLVTIFTSTQRGISIGHDGMAGGLLGPEFSQPDIEHRLAAAGARFSVVDVDELIETTAAALASAKTVGWFQGRMEFGPRALGARSILADPRAPDMQRKLNLQIKYREDFRPFAPAVLREDVADWFDLDTDSPYMLFVADVLEASAPCDDAPEEERAIRPRQARSSRAPTFRPSRMSTIRRACRPSTRRQIRSFIALLKRFKETTGCPILVNTSFNVRGEPIVCTPEDAFRCFMGTGLDMLVVGRCIVLKSQQDGASRADYRLAFEPD